MGDRATHVDGFFPRRLHLPYLDALNLRLALKTFSSFFFGMALDQRRDPRSCANQNLEK